jgi:hypothetical protein
VVFVPTEATERVRFAMCEAGAGRSGNYDHCSFTTRGEGRFRPLAGANPHIGSAGKLEVVVEDRIEVDCCADVLPVVLQAIRDVHPYEYPGIDIYPLLPFKLPPKSAGFKESHE